MRLIRRPVLAAATLALVAPWTPWLGGADAVVDDVITAPVPEELCSDNDRLEPGLQGDVPKADQDDGTAKDGYNCGLSLVGHTVIEQYPEDDAQEQARTGNANMAWAGDCAYVAGPGAVSGLRPSSRAKLESDGVAVIDASDPTNPFHVTTLQTAGAVSTIETLHAAETAERSILVVGEYGNPSAARVSLLPNPGKSDVPMDVYDVSDCASPDLLGTIVWPESIHNLTLSGNLRYVFATLPLQVYDIAPLLDGTGEAAFLGNLEEAIPKPLASVGPGADLDDGLPRDVRESRPVGDGTTLAHEAWPSHDGTTLYVGGITTTSETVTVVDLESWLARDGENTPAGPPEIILQRTGRGHSIRTATVGEGEQARDLLLHSEESVMGQAKGCYHPQTGPFVGPAEPYLMDITDTAAPVTVSHFGLEINRRENCAAQLDSGVDASSHYHDVDDPDDTTFAMVSMWHAGLRVFDIRDPEHPAEVAYFNPADVSAVDGEVLLDKAWGHIRWVPETGHIWFATESGGFWVVEMAPQVREHLGLDGGSDPLGGGRPPVATTPGGPDDRPGHRPEFHRPTGHPGTLGAQGVDPSLAVDATPYYCPLGAVNATSPPV